MSKIMYILLLVGSFLLGWYDNGDITFFVMLAFFGLCEAVEGITGRVKSFRRNYKIVIKKLHQNS